MAVLKYFNPTTEQWEAISASSDSSEGILAPLTYRVTLEIETNTVDLSNLDFNENKAIFFTFQNSTFIGVGSDYTISNKIVNKINGNWSTGTVLEFIILRPINEDTDLLYTSEITEEFIATEDNTNIIPFDILYDGEEKDRLKVYYKGIILSKDENYSVNADNKSIALLDWVIGIEDKIKIVILKKVANYDNVINGTQLKVDSVEKAKLSSALREEIDGKVGIESGSNANGRYIKFDDGTMFCYMSLILTYIDANKLTASFAYPATFFIAPTVVANVDDNFAGINSLSIRNVFIANISSTACNVNATPYTTNAFASGNSIGACVIAIGRWKA